MLSVEVELLREAEVAITIAIERIQPGFGRETACMSRGPELVGTQPGRYEVQVAAPRMPLEPGEYKIGLYLVMLDPAMPGGLVVLAGYSWLNGNGMAVTVEKTMSGSA